jgi:hypothetical protein
MENLAIFLKLVLIHSLRLLCQGVWRCYERGCQQQCGWPIIDYWRTRHLSFEVSWSYMG